jgi:hypothetical protein
MAELACLQKASKYILAGFARAQSDRGNLQVGAQKIKAAARPDKNQLLITN